MNKKRTNYLVAILNIISVATFYIFTFSSNFLMSSIMSGETAVKSIYNSFLIDTLLNNIQIIFLFMYGAIGIINIICAVQNKKDKKLFFWQLVFGIYYFLTSLIIVMTLIDINKNIIYWIEQIIYSIVPIILAIINLILIKKHKPKVIQVISYIAVIILSILSLLELINTYWQVIAVVMQLIYIHRQDKNMEESNSRRIVNIILYYILQLILVVIFLVVVLSSLLITKINDVIWESELSKLYNNISSMQGATNKEICVPVEINHKYGFISQNGQEKIPCEYDRVSFFNEIEINNNKYYIAFAKKDTKYYILSKNNDVLNINNNLEKYLQTMDEHWGDAMIQSFNPDREYRNNYINAFEFFFQILNRPGKVTLTQQIMQANDTNEISLTEKNSKYYYTSKNFSMLVEPIYDDSEEEDEYYANYDDNGNYYDEDENTYYVSSYESKCKVSISKTDGDIQSSIVYLPGFKINEATLETFSNGYIEFKTEDGTKTGWYDLNGNPTVISSNYQIKDIKNDKVILCILNTDENEDSEFNFMIIDLTGKTLLRTSVLDIYDNSYLVKNDNKKMVLIDKNLNIISNEYDKIITTLDIDLSPTYSSYYIEK